MELKFEDVFLIRENITSINDYCSFCNVYTYLNQVYKLNLHTHKGTPLDIDLWTKELNYSDKTKLLRRISAWLNLTKSIPLKFIDLINAKQEDIFKCLELDKEDFENALKLAIKPEYFQYRAMTCVYPVVKFPHDITEEEAINYAHSYVKKHVPWPVGVTIGYMDIKTIFISSDGDVFTTIYPPEITIKNGFMTFSTTNRNLSKVKIL